MSDETCTLAAHTKTLSLPELAITHARHQSPEPHIIRIPRSDHHSVIVQLEDFRSHKLWRGEQLIYQGSHAKGMVAITHLQDDWRCQHLSSYNNLRITIPANTLDQLTDDIGQKRIHRLEEMRGYDATVYHLAQLFLPILEQPDSRNQLLTDHVTQAFLSHLVQSYGNGQHEKPRGGGLAHWQERRAKEFMAAHLARGISLEEVARHCGLSRAHFSRGFKQNTGVMAHTWLHQLRINKAKHMLVQPDYSLPTIALECGFADQSHLTRAFKKATGAPPGTWRKLQF